MEWPDGMNFDNFHRLHAPEQLERIVQQIEEAASPEQQDIVTEAKERMQDCLHLYCDSTALNALQVHEVHNGIKRTERHLNGVLQTLVTN